MFFALVQFNNVLVGSITDIISPQAAYVSASVVATTYANTSTTGRQAYTVAQPCLAYLPSLSDRLEDVGLQKRLASAPIVSVCVHRTPFIGKMLTIYTKKEEPVERERE